MMKLKRKTVNIIVKTAAVSSAREKISKKIGLFAGVFDPIHLGHTDFIARAIKENDLDKVYVLVEREPKYKTCIAGYVDRLEMVKLAIAEISQAEIYESKAGSFPLTASLPEIKKSNPDAKLFILAGADVAKHINEWENARELLEGIELIVADRTESETYGRVSSLKIRRKITAGEKPELAQGVLDYAQTRKLY